MPKKNETIKKEEVVLKNEDGDVIKGNEEVPTTKVPTGSVKAKGTEVVFTEEQAAVVTQMIADQVRSSSHQDTSVSVYGQRDPKTIETVKVKRVDGMFVIGFKDHQKDPFKKGKVSQYVEYKTDPIRKLANQPYITLILSDGKETIEKEMMHVDYMTQREGYDAKVVDLKKKEVILNNGLLGSTGSYARQVDEKGNPVQRQAIRAESKMIVQTFQVELPGFDGPVTFVDDPKGPLA